ncbi:AAA family ATPase [Aulosira sp. FACHB-615]|uniref:DnaB-like helicase N-terminal domain-containing protein n=1 Tax=Aulosira sp. FACHB-615 TaxID=2692777 RepID=UPI001685148A|nr:AAA family ATPase [Aulosira sp. FACHB-615]MBD2492399.1 AAA family ATPase [Aulosira sp. FACHB-615]
MTQGIYRFPQFEPTPDGLPPENIEAEEAVLGALLLDEQAIYRVKDRLKVEHFYIDAHKDIYQACLRLHKKNQPVNTITVTTWLTDHKLLRRVGGRNKIATIIDRTVSSVNIDALATLVIEKSIRRDLLRLGNDFIHLGYNTEIELEEILDVVYKKTRTIVETPSIQTKEEYEFANYNRLIDQLKVINTTIPDPGFRLWKLQSLANECQPSLTVRFLDHLYTKTLASQCTSLMTYEELKIAAGKTVREWLLQGLVPKKTTIVLYSDGGLGKTKFIYGLGKALIQGKAWGDFHSTGSKRKILYYQGDETEADMYHALSAMGYDDSDVNEYVRTRMNWSFENIPQLIQDLNEFKPDFVVIDSLTHANRMSIYKESEVEYARPLLEITGLANQHNCTFLIIHHANKEGGLRGSTAIRNAVSEVWRITKDNSPEATPDDRFLEIDKSRSRSSGKKYRMIFSGDDLSFTYLGEETNQTETGADRSAKDKLLKFFDRNRNVKYSVEELVHEVGFTSGHIRNCLSSLAIDGLISVDRKVGRHNLYYIEGDREVIVADREFPADHLPITSDSLRMTAETIPLDESQLLSDESIKKSADHLRSPADHLADHLLNVDTSTDTAIGDRLSTENFLKKSPFSKNEEQFSRSPDHQSLEALQSNDSGGDRQGDREVIGRSVPITSDQQFIAPPPAKKGIEIGQVYLSWSLGKQVKVVKIYSSAKKASVRVAGDAIAKPKLQLADLFPLPDDDWKPNTGKLAMYGGELVAIVGFRNNGREFQIEFKSGRLDYAKAKQLAKPEL